MQDLMQWKHFNPTNPSDKQPQLLQDPILKEALRYLSYVFMNEVHASAVQIKILMQKIDVSAYR